MRAPASTALGPLGALTLALLLAAPAAAQEQDAPQGDAPAPEAAPAKAPVSGVELFPLGEGRRWRYSVTFRVLPTGEDQEPPEEAPPPEGGHNLVVYGTPPQEVDGRPTAVVEWLLDGELAQRSFFVVEEGDVRCVKRIQGFAEHMKDFVLEPPQTILPAGLEVGQTWEWRGKVNGVPSVQRFECPRRETVDTPAGTFETLVVVIEFEGEDDSHGTTTRWLAPGVGIVKDVSEVTTALSVFRTEGILTDWERED